MRHCAECGKKINPDDRFCRLCGSDLSAADAITWEVNKTELRHKLQSIDNYEFEQFIADLWGQLGWTTTVSSASVDAGIDVTATKDTPYPEKQLIQVKRYSDDTTVGGPDIQQYASLRHQQRDADAVVVVTSSSFTRHAEERAQELNVKLVDGYDLTAMVENLEAYEIVERYISLDLSKPKQEMDENHPQQDPSVTTSNSDVHGTVEDLAPESNTSATLDDTVAENLEREERTLSESGSDPAIDNKTEPHERSIEAISNPNSSQTKLSSSESLPDGKWKTAIKGCTAGWVVLLIFIQILPDALTGLGLLILWFGLPIAIYKDSQELKEYSNWPNHRWIYTGASLIWILNIAVGAVYLWRRSQAQQKNSASFTDTNSTSKTSEESQKIEPRKAENNQNHQASNGHKGVNPSINISMSMKGTCRECGGRMDLTTDEDDTLYGHCEDCDHQFKQPLCQYQEEGDSCQKRAVPGTIYCYEHKTKEQMMD